MAKHSAQARITAIVAVVLSGISSCGLAQTATETSGLSATSIRKALAQEHAAIAAHPNDPANYIDLAYTLTDAGMGEQARIAAADATRIAPTVALAFSAEGWVLHHNSIGVDYGSGFDYDGALRAYRRAIELDPKDLDVRQSLANLLEFNREGVRYAPDAQLLLAIEAYRYVKQHQRPLHADVVDNLSIDLFYAGRYEDAVRELAGLPGTVPHLGVTLSSVAASKGSTAAIAVADQIQGDEQRRKDALNFAAEGLWNKRLYPQAADLLTASLPDSASGPSITSKIKLFRDLKPFNENELQRSDPRWPVQRLLKLSLTGTVNESSLKELISRQSQAGTALRPAVPQTDAMAGTLLALMRKTGLPRVVVADIVLSKLNLTAPAESGLSTPVRVQAMGLPAAQYFVVFEDGSWKIAAATGDASAVGSQALHLLLDAKSEAANKLLNWFYGSLIPSADPNDPLSGELFARLWEPSEREATHASLLAAASLATDASELRPLIPDILKEQEKASSVSRRTNLDLLLAKLYLLIGDGPNAHAVTSRLLAQYPGSFIAVRLAGKSYGLNHDWANWKELVAKRLQVDPANHQLLLESATEAVVEGDYSRARQAYQDILNSSQATSVDYSTYAQLALLEDKPDEKALAAAQQGPNSATGRDYQSLLTVAWLDAARGRTAEAHQELLDAMFSANLDEPDAGIWYGFGRIFEQYGAIDAAVSAYDKAEQMVGGVDTQSVNSAVSPSLLARTRLNSVKAK